MTEAELVSKVERILTRLGLRTISGQGVKVQSSKHPIEPDGGLYIHLDNEAVGMFQSEVKVESILGTQTVPGWAVYKMVHDPGRRYYADMSGDPPSDEMMPVKEVQSVGEAVKVMVLTYVEGVIDDCYDVFCEEEEVTEL